MHEKCRSIYQIARNNAGLTQLEASDKLKISVRSLADYESDRTIPHSDIVADMVKVYGASWLGYKHLRRSSRLGMEILPEINFTDVAKSVLILQKETLDVESVKNCMIGIACDSKVENHEEHRWNEVTKEVRELAGAALSVVFSR